jgi:hypothetical protein
MTAKARPFLQIKAVEKTLKVVMVHLLRYVGFVPHRKWQAINIPVLLPDPVNTLHFNLSLPTLSIVKPRVLPPR